MSDSFSVLFGDGRQAVFPPPADPQHPAARHWQSAETLFAYFKDGERFFDADDQIVAIMPAVTYP